MKPNITVVVHPFDGEIYAQLTNLSTSYDVFVHGAMEVPDISRQKHFFPETDYTTVEFLALEILTSEDAKKFEHFYELVLRIYGKSFRETFVPFFMDGSQNKLTFYEIFIHSLKPSQRNCRLENESEELLSSSVYSYNLCRSECRFKISLKKCNCIPYFYRNIDKSGRRYPICGPEGMRCLGKMKSLKYSKNSIFFKRLSNFFFPAEMISLKSNTTRIDCNCMQNCDNTNFFVQSIVSLIKI
jgi:acid-sensing ion channel, other